MYILLLLVLCCAMTACGKYKAPPTEPPMNLPTAAPTEAPAPTAAPTEAPTVAPTEAPTEASTEAPTEPPTEPPTEAPTEAPTEEPDEEVTVGDKIAQLAREQLEKPYSNGGSGPDSFDVSGLVYYCFREYAIKVPRTVKEQAGYGEKVEKEDLLPGDVVFFYNDDPEKIQYCGIYVGDDMFIAARNSDKPVSEMGLKTNYFSERYMCARRFWE